jgi:hypothetical protein
MNAIEDTPETEPDENRDRESTETTLPTDRSADDGRPAAMGSDTDYISSEVASAPVQIDQVFEILKNARRRAVLRYMRTVGEDVRLGELAEQIAAWECDKDVSQITSSERKRVYVGLYQSHLPKMADVGAISYNKPRGKIGPGEHMTLFEEYLPTESEDTESPWTDNHQAILLGALTLVFALVAVAIVL